jgi:hypothetical protein
MEHQIAYSALSDEARRAWETISGLPMTSTEQHCHAWEVLRAELPCLANDRAPGLHIFVDQQQATVRQLYLSGPELAALRVMVAWLKANDRSGRLRDLPVAPDLGETILAQLGEMPWNDVWESTYLYEVERGGTLWLNARTTGAVLALLLDATLSHARIVCPTWPLRDRQRLFRLLADVRCWLEAMLTVQDQESPA